MKENTKLIDDYLQFGYDKSMVNPFPGEILILILLIISCGRIFFPRYIETDSISVIPPCAFALSVLQILAWNADFTALLLFVLSAAVFFANISYTVRFSEHLKFDYFSPLFCTVSILFLLCSLFISAVIILYRPVTIRAQDFSVTEKRENLKGTFSEGLSPASFSEKPVCTLYTYEPADRNLSNNTQILFLPDRRSAVYFYRPYLMLLAQKGYTVIAADFNSPEESWISPVLDSRFFLRTSLIIRGFSHPDPYPDQDRSRANIEKEYTALLSFMLRRAPGTGSVFIAGDCISSKAMLSAKKNSAGKIHGIFALETVPEYKSAGYGCIEQTDVLLASTMHLKRDASCFIPRLMALETDNAVKNTGAAK